ncbi:hypothetical protein [Actinopolymorpha pittospori]
MSSDDELAEVVHVKVGALSPGCGQGAAGGGLAYSRRPGQHQRNSRWVEFQKPTGRLQHALDPAEPDLP